MKVQDAPPKKTKDMFHVHSHHILEAAKLNIQWEWAVMHQYPSALCSFSR